MRSLKRLAIPAALCATMAALGQDDSSTTGLSSLFGGGSFVSLIVIGLLAFFGFRLFFSGGD
jgi:hypothetical protein